jgi:preprotein translocase subunit SecA
VILGLVQQLVVPETVSAVRNPSSQRQEQAPRQASGPSNKLAVLVAERHALRSEDNRVVQFLRRLDHPSELAFFLAFDDPLLGPNLDATVLQLLEHYGMRPDEPLQSQLLERLVRRVQRQHERHAG